MQIIKFRAFNKDTKAIEELDQIPLPNTDGLESDGRRMIYMMYTGLTDCNGREIYEGDILARIYYPQGEKYIGKQQTIVAWRATRTRIGWNIGLSAKDDGRHYEIIGNIYEHSTLSAPAENS